jgi:hypothetical protein
MPALIACPKCSAPWPDAPEELALFAACPICATPASVIAFPALYRTATPAAQPENIIIEGEASCFYHANKRAVVPCSACGRFLCALCDVKLGDRNLCPGCVETGRTKGKFTELEPGRTLWDSAALTIAIVSFVLCMYPSIIGAPVAIVVAIVGWKKPSSVVPRTKWRLWLAVILATLEIAWWIFFFIMVSTRAIRI